MRVEHALNGSPGAIEVVPLSKAGTCALRFEAGERWLYAGSSALDPSVRLGSGGPLGALARVDDSRAGLDARMQSCRADGDCALLAYGCSRTAAAKARLEKARARAWRSGGDPRTVNCATKPGGPALIDKPLCVRGRCGLWRFPD